MPFTTTQFEGRQQASRLHALADHVVYASDRNFVFDGRYWKFFHGAASSRANKSWGNLVTEVLIIGGSVGAGGFHVIEQGSVTLWQHGDVCAVATHKWGLKFLRSVFSIPDRIRRSCLSDVPDARTVWHIGSQDTTTIVRTSCGEICKEPQERHGHMETKCWGWGVQDSNTIMCNFNLTNIAQQWPQMHSFGRKINHAKALSSSRKFVVVPCASKSVPSTGVRHYRVADVLTKLGGDQLS